ncbi:MAG: DUF4010 domain-containing protein [Desulfurococcales archaeon]|nr:DUF4010 domain-containing protein [Desulfurococcales archaeon]
MQLSTELGVFTTRMLIAFFTGALIGLERERTRIRNQKKYDLPGLRSFGLTGLFGGLTSYLTIHPYGLNGSIIFSASTIGFLIVLVFYIIHRAIILKLTGITTYLTLLITYTLGIMCGLGLLVEAVSASILATFVLAIKYPSRKLIRELSYKEFIALLEVGTLSLILGPIIYSLNVTFLGLSVFKVYIFFMIVLLISLFSYFLVKVFGTVGLESSAVLGSLVNSEATIASITSILDKIEDELTWNKLLRSSTLIVISTLHVRSAILALVAVYTFLSTQLATELILPVLIATLPAIGVLTVLSIRRGKTMGPGKFVLESPLNWGGALRTAIAYSILTLTVYLVSSTYKEFLPLVAFLGGLVNATATIFSLTAYASSLPLSLVASSLLLSIASATLNKVFYLSDKTYRTGRWKMVFLTSILMSIPFFAVALFELLQS